MEIMNKLIEKSNPPIVYLAAAPAIRSHNSGRNPADSLMIPEAVNLNENEPAGPVTHKPANITTPNLPHRWFGKLWKGALLFIFAAGSLFFFVYQTTQNTPEFYLHLSQQPEEVLAVAGDQFETKVLDVQNAIQQVGNWRGIFREEEINGWLSIDCPAKFPELIPEYVIAPRIQILESEFRLAFRYCPDQNRKYFSPFIVIVGDIFVAEPSGEIALRIKQVKSGVLPIPFARFVEGLSDHVQQNGVDVEWTEFDGDPVALISIPPEHLRLGDRLVRVDSVICAAQQVELVGKSTEFEPATN